MSVNADGTSHHVLTFSVSIDSLSSQTTAPIAFRSTRKRPTPCGPRTSSRLPTLRRFRRYDSMEGKR